MQRHRIAVADGVTPFLAFVAALLIALMALAAVDLAERDFASYAVRAFAHAALYVAAVVFVAKVPGRGLDLMMILCVAVFLRAIAMWTPATLPGAGLAAGEPMLGFTPWASALSMVMASIPGGRGGQQFAMALAEGVVILALLGWLAHERLPRERVLIYAWHPLPLWEFAGMAHFEAVSVALTMVALFAAARRYRNLAGGFLGLAIAIRTVPLAFVPVVWRRDGGSSPLITVIMTASVIGSFVIANAVSGNTIAWPSLEQMWATTTFPLQVSPLFEAVGLIAPTSAQYMAGALVLILAAATAVAAQRNDAGLSSGHLLLLGTLVTVLLTHNHAWQFAWLVPLLAVRLSPSVLFLTLAAVLHHLTGAATWATGPNLVSMIVGLFLVTALLEDLWTFFPIRRETVPGPQRADATTEPAGRAPLPAPAE